jgi:small subunit ribosomal protein S17
MADKADKGTGETPESEPDTAAEAAAPEEAGTPEAEAGAPEAEAGVPEAEASEHEAAPEAEVPAEAAPEAEVAPEEAPAEEATEAPAAEADAPADEAETEAPAQEEQGEAASAAGAPPAELTPKERRRRARSTHSGEAKPPRSPEERQAERVAERRMKAIRRRARRLQERAKSAERRTAAPDAGQLAPVHAPVEGKRKIRQGVVVSDKAEKTITVRIEVARRHRRYEKIVRSSSTVHAHDENNDAHEGDVVRVIESRPLSRSKRWALIDVLERAQ